jgi:alkylhydroperoxidase family enzyme
MSRIEPVDLESVPALEEVGRFYEEVYGFVPNGLRIMAHRPSLVEAFIGFRRTAIDPPGATVPAELKHLIAHVASHTAGSVYCEAHTIFGAARAGSGNDRLNEVWHYETSDSFTPAEKAALSLAAAAAAVPNRVTDELFTEVRRYWEEGEIVEIMAVVALFGFLNRWNSTFQTTLETPSLKTAEQLLGPKGWEAGRHG